MLRKELEALKAKLLSGGSEAGEGGTDELARKIREDAEHANLCAQYGWRPFEIPERGDVLCSVDGKPVTTPSQVWAEPEFWSAMDWAATALVLGLGPSLTHRASDATFVAPSGRLAVSRERHDLRAFEENGGASEATEEWASEAVEGWERVLAEGGEAAGLLADLLALAEAADVPDTFVPPNAEWYEGSEVGGLGSIFEDAEERERARRLTWTLMHDPEARATFSQLTLRRDAFVAD